MEEEGLWLQALSECAPASVGKRLLVLGDDEADKSALVGRLQGEDRLFRGGGGNGLEYRSLAVRDEFGDSQGRMGVWILDGDPFYRPLLRFALDERSLSDTTVLLVASMTRPWDVLATLEDWTRVLAEHLASLDLGEGEREACRMRVLDRFRDYVEPGLSAYGSLPGADPTRELEQNLGVELVVAVARTEHMRELRTDPGYEEEHFDHLQRAVRGFCLARGAALFYVSVREDRNCDHLLRYLLHRAYGTPFRLPGVLLEPDALIVPAGWDTAAKIRFFSDALPGGDLPFEEVVFRPARPGGGGGRAEPEVVARGDQDFLADLLLAAEQLDSVTLDAADRTSTDVGRDASASMTASVVQRNVARRMSRAQLSPKKQKEARIVEGDSTLSSFFHSLLSRRTSAPVDRPLGGISGSRTLAPAGKDLEKAEEEEVAAIIPGDEHHQDDPRLRLTAHLSLDQDRQLPEYFLRDQGPEPSPLQNGQTAAPCDLSG